MPYYCLTSCKKSKILACSSEAIFEKVQLWAKFDLLTPLPGIKSFFRKLENVIFLHLCCSNFVQNIKKFWHADPEISALQMNGQTDGRTDEQTDEAEFIGLFRTKSQTIENKPYKPLDISHINHEEQVI